jgi:hypothetical protein
MTVKSPKSVNDERRRDYLRGMIGNNDTIAIIRNGGSVQHKWFEIIVADKKGHTTVITTECCSILDCSRGGRDHNGGLRAPGGWTAQDVVEELGRQIDRKINFVTY